MQNKCDLHNSHFILIWAISTIYYFCLIYLVKNRYYGRHHEPYNSGYSYHGRKVSPWESDSTGRQDEDEFWDEHEQDMKSKYRNRVQGNFCKMKMIFQIKFRLNVFTNKIFEILNLIMLKVPEDVLVCAFTTKCMESKKTFLHLNQKRQK